MGSTKNHKMFQDVATCQHPALWSTREQTEAEVPAGGEEGRGTHRSRSSRFKEEGACRRSPPLLFSKTSSLNPKRTWLVGFAYICQPQMRKESSPFCSASRVDLLAWFGLCTLNKPCFCILGLTGFRWAQQWFMFPNK